MNPSQSPAANGSPSREEALDWFVRRRDQGLDAEEEHAFQAWLDQAPSNRDAFKHWQSQWQSFDAIPQDLRNLLQSNMAYDQAMEAASGAARETVRARRESASTEAVASSSAKVGPRRRGVLVPVLSVAVMAASIGAGGLAWTHWQAQPTYIQSFSSKRGQQLDATLPDGTRLRLDTATRVEVKYYRKRRAVKLLEGQAMFEVAANPDQPFDVNAGPVLVTVVGTRFAVRYVTSLPGESGVRVAVEEGRVRVMRADAGEQSEGTVLLSAGQQIVSDQNGHFAATEPVAAVEVAPWRNRRVRFDSQRLDRVLAELARYGDVPLVINDAAVAALPVTGVFDPRDLSTFQRVLPASLPVKLKATGQGSWEIVLR